MPRHGTVQRQYPRVEVLRGFNPMEPQGLTQAHPVKEGVTILSGQVVSLLWNTSKSRYEWIRGVDAAENAGAIPYIAYNDSQDFDVLEADKLPALSAAGDYEIETPFFKDGDTYNVDTPLTYDGVTGNLKATTLGSGAPIVGFVTRNHGPKSLVGINSGAVNLNVISFQTKFLTNPA